MKQALLLTLSLLLTAAAIGQTEQDVIATVAGKNLTPASLSDEGRKLYLSRDSSIREYRSSLVSQMIRSAVLDLEAAAAKSTPEKLVVAAGSAVAEPTTSEIQAVFDANKETLGGRQLPEVRDEIVRFIKSQKSQKAVDDYVSRLESKYKAKSLLNVNDAGLKTTDAIAVIGANKVTYSEFQTKYRIAINDFERRIYDDIRRDLMNAAVTVILAEDAKASGKDPSDVYAAEVTNKLRLFTDEERLDYEATLRKRLLARYPVKISISEPPAPIKQNIETDADDPAIGPVSAPVTVVMFGDFQCPACAATHPVLRRVVAEYGVKVRLVERDFPIEKIHENAFGAALAAYAANAQGKFFEFAELLYTNQDNLDETSLKKYATRIGLNLKKFELDFTDAKAAADVRRDIADANKYGVSWTPTIYVNGVKLMQTSADDIREAIDSALAK